MSAPVPSPSAFVPDRRRGILLALLTSAVWGTVPLGGVVALRGIDGSTLSAVRLAAAGLFVILLTARRQREFGPLLRRPSGLLLLAALGLAANYSTYMWGLERAGPLASQVLIQTAPLFLIGLSVAFLGERPRPRQWAGAALALAGVFLVSWNGRDPAAAFTGMEATGVGLILLAAGTWGIYATAQKRLGAAEGSGSTIGRILLLSAIFTLPMAAIEGGGDAGRRPDAVEVGAILYLCLNSVVAYWAFAEALRHVEASVVAVICTMGPVVTTILMAVFNRIGWERIPEDPITAWKLGGAALVMGGVALAVGSGTTFSLFRGRNRSASGGAVPSPEK